MNMKKLLLSLFSTSLLTQAAIAVALTGVWQGAEHDLSFTQTGQNATGTCQNLSTTLIQNYGFTNGESCIYGTFSGTTFSGKTLVRYPIEFKSKCPTQWSKWTDIILAISSDGNTLTGRWRSNTISTPSCLETDNGWVDTTFTRKTLINSTDSTNNCTATFNMSTGRLVIPCLAVSMTSPFGGAEQIFNYGIEMQQRSGAFVFDLDLSKVVQR